MNHPNREELAEFLYDELSPSRREEVADHVETCDACRTTIESWRGVRTNLAAWKLPDALRGLTRGHRGAGALRWAAAAAVLLGTGYGLARVTAPKPADLAGLRAELARDVRQEVRQELTSEFARYTANQNVQQREFQEAVVQAMTLLETRQVADNTSLRKDVETVALHAQQQFARLTSLGIDNGDRGDAPVQ